MTHTLELFLSEHCLGCPEARRIVYAFAARRPDVTVVERDIGIDAERQRARAHGLVATPALLIDGRRVMYGVPRVDTLTAHVDRDRGLANPPPAVATGL